MGDFDISGNSLQLDCSVDSGICIDVAAADLKKKLQEFKRILYILERDKEARALLRERLSRIAERKTSRKKKDEQLCNVCFASVDTEDLKTCIACCSCAKYVCRGGDKCSEWVPKGGEWICRLCSSKADSYGKTSTWVEEQLSVKKATPAYAYPMRARSEIYIPLCDPNDSAFLCNFESVSEAPSSINVNQKQQIREYIEEVLAEMLGGSLDRTPVGQLSKSERYIPAGGNEQELQGVSHVRLRRLIESIIAETVRSSGSATTAATADDSIGNGNLESLTFNGNHCNGNIGQYFAPKKYQDLLATAVLNKIVDTHGNNSRHTESSPDLTSSTFDKNHNALFPNKTDESISSSSSIEPRSESSLTDPVHGNNKGDDLSPIGSYGNFYADIANENIEADRESVLSDFIASHMVPLPHISAETASDEEDDGDEDFISVASSGRDTTWEDNWLFKKKRSSKTASSIGMLVPAPKEDVRALIGDKPTDEVSDLSEIGSDSDDSSLEMVSATLEPVNDRLMNQHLIGGKNTKVVLDELVEENSLISTSSLPDNAAPYIETKNELVASNDGLSETEHPKISVSNCNETAISNEAVNSNVTKIITAGNGEAPAKEVKSCEEVTVVPPPSDFTDDDKMRNLMAKFSEEQSNKPDSGDDNSTSLSPRSSISCALSDRISSESNQTDDSTATVIDTFGSSQIGFGSDSDPGEEFSPDELTNRDSTSATITTTNTITTNNVTNQSHINSPPPPPPELRTESACSKLQTVETRTTGGNEEHVDDDPLKHLVPGSIAEREYKKWYNAVDMPNNPYSAEALKRRLSGGPERVIDLPNISPSKEENPLKMAEDENKDAEDTSQERDYARYSRDYYINDAKHASGATKKRSTPATTPSMEKSFTTPTASTSSISSSSIELNSSNSSQTSPVDKLENQSKPEGGSDIYKAVPVQVEEEPVEEKDQKPKPTVVPLTTEAISKLSCETSPVPTTGSLTPSEDSDTIRIYDLKKQETRIIKENTTTVPESPLKKARPTDLEITPSLDVPTTSTPSSKTTTPTSFKFLQPKRKIINPSQVLSIDLDTNPITPTVVEKKVIEEDVAHAMPSVKALARAFLISSSTCSTSDKWRKARTKSPTTLVKPTPQTPTTIVIQKPAERPPPADTTSQGSEDATIASDLSSLETDPPSKQDLQADTIALPDQSNQERPLSPVLVPGCLKNNIAFFENLKNK